MTPRSPQSGIPPVLRKPPIAEELDKLRELPPRTTNREPLSRLERLAILEGLRGGLSTSRIAKQWSMSVKTLLSRSNLRLLIVEHCPFEVAFLSGGHPNLHAVSNHFQIFFAEFAKQILIAPFHFLK